MESEKRKFTRFPLKMSATLEVLGKSFNADKLSNLSIGGCLVPISEALAPDTPCTLTIMLGMTKEEPTIIIDGIVIRSYDGNVAIKFTRVDPDSLFHLQMLARYNSPDSEKIDEEIHKHPGIL
jgi:hypothetical protein